MLKILKLIVWIVGFAVVGLFILGYFGYEVNKNYFNESKKRCKEEILKECTSELIHQGIDNAECEMDCVDPKLIIKKIK